MDRVQAFWCHVTRLLRNIGRALFFSVFDDFRQKRSCDLDFRRIALGPVLVTVNVIWTLYQGFWFSTPFNDVHIHIPQRMKFSIQFQCTWSQGNPTKSEVTGAFLPKIIENRKKQCPPYVPQKAHIPSTYKIL
ncbi:hypothetical protein B0H19DRAFT_1071293 [Mycena capillaripes]|nr:hypothetical protein B0H19DRAFT_1071293 [Mycena capillaripes]